MAAPGLGIGDLVSACAFIWRQCVKYKDAPKEFDEIAEKAKSTAVVLERIDTEAKISGNLVERAGPQAFEQLEDNLKSLRRDADKLEALVKKYSKIHDEGPGRRLLFALKESSDLTDLRRRIGLHEQTLQLWYMTLVYGSLRRLEGTNEEILKAIDAIKDWHPRTARRVRSALYEGDARPLEQELRRSGVRPNSEVSCNAAEFVMADSAGQVAMESRARMSSTLSAARPSTDDQGMLDRLLSSRREYVDKNKAAPEIRRTRSTSHRHRPDYIIVRSESGERERPARSPRKHSGRDGEDGVVLPSPSRRHRRASDESKAALHSPLLVVPDGGPLYRSTSAHSPEDKRPPRSPDRRTREAIVIHPPDPTTTSPPAPVIIQSPGPRPPRSSSQGSHRSARHERDSSTHSFHRVRRSSLSADGDSREKIRMVTRMDRIDSIPMPTD